MDLTKITSAFGLLDEETQTALRKHYEKGGVIEYYNSHGKWEKLDSPMWGKTAIYRAGPVDLSRMPKKNWPRSLTG